MGAKVKQTYAHAIRCDVHIEISICMNRARGLALLTMITRVCCVTFNWRTKQLVKVIRTKCCRHVSFVKSKVLLKPKRDTEVQ